MEMTEMTSVSLKRGSAAIEDNDSVAPAEEARVAHVLCLRSTSAKEKPESLHT